MPSIIYEIQYHTFKLFYKVNSILGKHVQSQLFVPSILLYNYVKVIASCNNIRDYMRITFVKIIDLHVSIKLQFVGITLNHSLEVWCAKADVCSVFLPIKIIIELKLKFNQMEMFFLSKIIILTYFWSIHGLYALL
jgi:hypothetical protein